MAARAVIEQAKGIIIARLGVAADAAFGILVKQSQAENRKVRQLAQELVDRNSRAPQRGASAAPAPEPPTGPGQPASPGVAGTRSSKQTPTR
jgi:hypothetical protein